MEGLTIASLIVSIIAAIIAIISIVQAIYLRQQTKRENEEQFTFMANIIIHQADDPFQVMRKLQDSHKYGMWGPAKVIWQKNGKIDLRFK